MDSFIYHEKQEKGSMLCAQHALNNLLQGNYYSAPDLSAIANNIDSIERAFIDSDASTNMDDTGFFSVQVLEHALNVWGLSLVNWHSESLRAYHPNPSTQLAFILNSHQHWFTLRRFGPAEPHLPDDPGHGQWYNLNSFLPAPEWVGKTYLGMVLHQAEQEGYTVFAVTQQDPTRALALPRTQADEHAAHAPDPPSSSGAHLSTVHTPGAGFEDEDMDLQAALQASLVAHGDDDSSFSATPALDPVAASTARARAMLDHFTREQESALRAGYEDEVARGWSAADPPANADEEHEEEIRRAILASQADDGPTSPPAPRGDRVYDDDDADLQAALRASLEHVPPGFVLPPPQALLAPPPFAAMPAAPQEEDEEEFDTASEGETDTTAAAEDIGMAQVEEEPVDMNEMRRRRLARFGG